MTRDEIIERINEIDALPEGDCHPDTYDERDQLIHTLRAVEREENE